MILENVIEEREFLVIHPLHDIQASGPHADDPGGPAIPVAGVIR